MDPDLHPQVTLFRMQASARGCQEWILKWPYKSCPSVSPPSPCYSTIPHSPLFKPTVPCTQNLLIGYCSDQSRPSPSFYRQGMEAGIGKVIQPRLFSSVGQSSINHKDCTGPRNNRVSVCPSAPEPFALSWVCELEKDCCIYQGQRVCRGASASSAS